MVSMSKICILDVMLYFFSGNDTQTHNGLSLTSDSDLRVVVGTYISKKQEDRRQREVRVERTIQRQEKRREV